MNALIIEDDPEERAFMRRGLTSIGYSCEAVADGQEGLERLLNRPYDLATVDLMLPGVDGKEIIRQVRNAGVKTHIIIVSALGSISERVSGLNIGADDYIPKPCSIDELKARIGAFRRRFAGMTPRVLEADGIELDTVSRTCRRNGRPIELSKIEFAILECLMRHRGALVTRGMLIEHAWGYDIDPITDIITPHISRIRRKLVLEGESDPLASKRNEGYVFR